MSLDLIDFNGKKYPALQARGFASQYSFALAKDFIMDRNVVYDIGFSNPLWQYPGSIGIDINKGDGFDAMNLPPLKADAIYSSHCLEHLPNYVSALNYWNERLQYKGILFLYLPNCEYQEYWRPTSNKKHVHYMTPHLMQKYFEDTPNLWKSFIVTEGYDLNGSFYAVAEKK